MAAKTEESSAVSVKKQQMPEQRYDLAKLQQNCKELFGVSTTVFVGATDGLIGKYTVSEIKEKIRKWSKQEVI